MYIVSPGVMDVDREYHVTQAPGVGVHAKFAKLDSRWYSHCRYLYLERNVLN